MDMEDAGIVAKEGAVTDHAEHWLTPDQI